MRSFIHIVGEFMSLPEVLFEWKIDSNIRNERRMDTFNENTLDHFGVFNFYSTQFFETIPVGVFLT